MKLPIALAVALTCAACGSDKQDVVNAWKQAGLEPTEFEPLADEALGKECSVGRVDGLEVTLCSYDDESAAEAAREPGLARIGDVTGTALTSDRLLMIVADRDGVDPSGRNINKLARAFAERPLPPSAKLPGQ